MTKSFVKYCINTVSFDGSQTEIPSVRCYRLVFDVVSMHGWIRFELMLCIIPGTVGTVGHYCYCPLSIFVLGAFSAADVANEIGVLSAHCTGTASVGASASIQDKGV